MDRDELAALDAAATNGPWTGYSEPDVGLPWSLFEGVPGQTGFAPLEPLTGGDVNLIAYLRNHVPDILALVDENARLREALELLRDLPIIENDGPDTLHIKGHAHTGPVVDYFFHAIRKIKEVARAALSPNPDQQED